MFPPQEHGAVPAKGKLVVDVAVMLSMCWMSVSILDPAESRIVMAGLKPRLWAIVQVVAGADWTCSYVVLSPSGMVNSKIAALEVPTLTTDDGVSDVDGRSRTSRDGEVEDGFGLGADVDDVGVSTGVAGSNGADLDGGVEAGRAAQASDLPRDLRALDDLEGHVRAVDHVERHRAGLDEVEVDDGGHQATPSSVMRRSR
jgi:hypothetical protein